MTGGASPATAGRYTGWIAAGLLLIFMALVSISIGAHAPVFHEPVFMAEGYAARGRERPSPASVLCALPLRFLSLRSPAVAGEAPPAAGPVDAASADRFLYRNLADPDTMLLLARIPSLVLGVLLGWLVYHWAVLMGGGAAGILALTTYVFSPVVLDHAGVAANDLPAAAAVSAGLFVLRRMAWRPAWVRSPFVRRAGAGGALALVCLLAFLTYRQIPVRLLLPAVPLLCVLAGQVVAGVASGQGAPTLPAGGQGRMLLVGALAAGMMAGALLAEPHFHAEDGGQDLKPLGAWYEWDQARHGPAEMILSYYGSGDPRYYGMLTTQALAPWPARHPAPAGPPRSLRHVNSRTQGRELLAVSRSNFGGGLAWLRDGERPARIIGHTIYVYDVTDRPDIHARLMDLYEALGCPVEAARERARSAIPTGAPAAARDASSATGGGR